MADKGFCFLGMPCGRTSAERLAYAQWKTQVLEPAIDAASYTPWVSEEDSAPVDIGAEILQNIVEAPMAVFDLGGFEPGDAANVNVMYELGIRHAFHMPAIVYSPDRTLPFDVQAGRAILLPRTLDMAGGVKDAIKAAIAEAEEGRFWKPMMAVASLDRLHEMLARRDDLAPLTELVLAIRRDMKAALRSEARERSGLAAIADSLTREAVVRGLRVADDPNVQLGTFSGGWRRMLPEMGAAIESLGRLTPETEAAMEKMRGSFPLSIGTANNPHAIRKPTTGDES